MLHGESGGVKNCAICLMYASWKSGKAVNCALALMMILLRIPGMSGNIRKSVGKEYVVKGGQNDKDTCAGP
jgi:hypothetical protein